jgi:hypothetical protein
VVVRPSHRRRHRHHCLDPRRAATAVLADLVETTVDLCGPELARQLGITYPGVLTPDVGDAVTRAGWCPPTSAKTPALA